MGVLAAFKEERDKLVAQADNARWDYAECGSL